MSKQIWIRIDEATGEKTEISQTDIERIARCNHYDYADEFLSKGCVHSDDAVYMRGTREMLDAPVAFCTGVRGVVDPSISLVEEA